MIIAGLAAAVHSKNIDTALRVSNAIKAGYVERHNFLPFII